ncbi:YdcF family protein [Brevibacillus thermoruber]|uniref:YdcF family protein n=1 Tax=Brevibacillus thermoruber TaxID=33942 RepID=UPI0009DFAFBF|nr:YdcF family protein [Brevibacillus thermoruber]
MWKRKGIVRGTVTVLVISAALYTPVSAQTEAASPAAPPSASAEAPASVIQNDEPTSVRINQLVDTAMYYYWHGGYLQQAEKEIFKGITLKGKYDVVEHAFREATILDPYNLDLKFSLASTQVIQKKLPEALQTYRQILRLDPDNFNATLLFAVYSKANGDERAFQEAVSRLRTIDPQRTAAYLEKLRATDEILAGRLNTAVPAGLPQTRHAIVILGYALADDGSMRQPLVDRLKTGLAVARQYPQANIIVTGGVPKQGVTEADAMSRWLVSQGIDQDRILLENKSTDTVENALFTTAILEREGIRDVTLVTSASHMRRALTVFREAGELYAKMNGGSGSVRFSHAASLDYPTIEEAQQVTKDERLVTYRDLLRASGIWAYPGKQR